MILGSHLRLECSGVGCDSEATYSDYFFTLAHFSSNAYGWGQWLALQSCCTQSWWCCQLIVDCSGGGRNLSYLDIHWTLFLILVIRYIKYSSHHFTHWYRVFGESWTITGQHSILFFVSASLQVLVVCIFFFGRLRVYIRSYTVQLYSLVSSIISSSTQV